MTIEQLNTLLKRRYERGFYDGFACSTIFYLIITCAVVLILVACGLRIQ